MYPSSSLEAKVDLRVVGHQILYRLLQEWKGRLVIDLCDNSVTGNEVRARRSFGTQSAANTMSIGLAAITSGIGSFLGKE